MAGDMAKRYRRWFEYEKDSHAKVLEALESAGASARKTRAFRKAVELAGHIVAARRCGSSGSARRRTRRRASFRAG